MMAYQVKAGALTIVAATTVAALKILEQFIQSGEDTATIHDMNGYEINVDVLRSALSDE